MRAMEMIVCATALVLMMKCAGSGPPLPDCAIEERGRTATKLFRSGEFTEAMNAYRMALKEARRFDLPEHQGRYWFNIGRIHYECAEKDSAIHCFQESRKLFVQAGRGADATVAGIFEIVTRAYAGDADSADMLLKALAPSVGRDDEAVFTTAQTIVALLQDDPDAADQACERTLALLRRRNDAHGFGVWYYYKARSSFMRRETGCARRYLDTSLIYFRRSPDRSRTWKTLLGRAIIEYGEGNVDEGDDWYRRAAAAVPDRVSFPARDMVRRSPSSWKP